MQRARETRASPALQRIERELCRRDIFHWLDWWCWTFNPKNVGTAFPAYLPFDLFPRQRALISWMDERVRAHEDGVSEKSRDIGWTWCCAAAYPLHKWLFHDGFKTNVGSRKQELVDKLGDPDSIFEKVRILYRSQPSWLMPEGFEPARHDNFMQLVNPQNGNTIRGEAGDEMGRGGRSTLYVLDEGAFMERADRVEAATSANSDVRIWGSTANGTGNLFFRKRGQLPARQVFRFHWTDDPRKTPEWAEKKQAELTEPWIWASEYDIDYSASVEGIAIPGKWVESAKKIRAALAARGQTLEPDIKGVGGFDVGAGKARSVLAPRFGPIVTVPTAWLDPDTTETAFRGLDASQESTTIRSDGRICQVRVVRFDEVGVGKGVLSTLTHHNRAGLTTVPINTGSEPSDTLWGGFDKTSKERFANLKAEVWFLMRERFKCTHEMLMWLEGKPGGVRHELHELISLPADAESPDAARLASELSLVKWGRNEKGLIVIETKLALAKRGVRSPDYADALALTFVPDSSLEDWIGAFAA